MTIIIAIPGAPTPFARSGGNGKLRFTPTPQRNYMAVVRDFASKAMDGAPPLDGALKMQLRAVYTTPASWSRKKAANSRWKTSKPDLDNVLKIIKDSMNSIVFKDDAQICWTESQKCFGPVAQVIVTIEPLDAGGADAS